MHTGVLLAVEADDIHQAIDKVTDWNEHNATWSDWNEVGGRWEHELPDNALRYSDNPTKFNELVAKYKQYTDNKFNEYVTELGEVSVRDLVTNPKYRYRPPASTNESDEDFRNRFALHTAKQLLKLANGEFFYDTHFFDLDEYSTSPDQLNERIKANPERQFVVICDYHF
jgi:hypothetical protein